MIIVLIGYMASGKSTLGKILADTLNYDFIDLDDFIEDKESLAVPDIFKTKGEIYFRKQEAWYLKELLNIDNNMVLSVGGGTPCYGSNMQLILSKAHVKSIYLKASISTLAGKLINKKANRPLIAHIKTKQEMTEFIGKHLFERLPFYNQAEIKVTIDNRTKNDIIEDIILRLF